MIFNYLKNTRRLYSKASNSFYATTPIFYVNAAPHIGHLYSAVIADTICRYQKLRYPEKNVRFCTGTDEHGTKIQQAAASHNVPVAKYCDEISNRYCDVFQQANIQYTDFIRTTAERHKRAVSHFWSKLKNSGHIYSAQYSGWYCVSDETFLTESQLRLDETTGSRYALESGHPVEWTQETNYMFSLSKLQDDVIYWLKQGEQVKPLKFEKILLDMLSEQLPDVSVSRPANRVHWAIPVPDDATQTIYVWLDALINYLTSVGYPDEQYRQYWPPTVQVIGKDILKFHGIYWPAFLIAASMEPPAQLFVHSHWTVDDQKMSKSKNNVVNPEEAAQQYTMEGLRYFLLREGVAHSDGNYSNTKALRILNSELADTLGNLLSRVCAKSLNPRQIYPALQLADLELILQLDAAKRLQEALDRLEAKCTQHYEECNFYLVVDTIMHTLHAANNFFEQMRPWEYKAGGKQENLERLETIIAMTMDALRLCGIALQPIVPQLSQRLLDKLNVPQEQRLWCYLRESFKAALKAERTVTGAALSTTLNAATVPAGKVHALCNTDAVLFRRIIMPAADTAAGMPAQKNVKTKQTKQQQQKQEQQKQKSKARQANDITAAA